jgi:uncharacterized membrane protein YhaH (DUF805 family)
MTFGESIKTCLSKKYANFDGRASRSEYWWYYLFNLILNWGVTFIDVWGMASGVLPFPVLSWIVMIGLLLPGLAVTVRRLHDTGRSGWNCLWALLPIVGIILLLVWWASKSTGDNKYGPVPND